MFIGEDTVVFWAEKKGIYEDLLLELLNPTIEKEEKAAETFEMNVIDLAKEILNVKNINNPARSIEDYEIIIDKYHVNGVKSFDLCLL